MTQEDKSLLLKDLCARLPYGVMADYENHTYVINEIDPACKDIDYITVRIQDAERLMCAESVMIEHIKPYLRPLSSMTEEEFDDMFKQLYSAQEEFFRNCSNNDTIRKIIANDIVRYDWFNAHHFDYRGLIEKSLAIEAPKGMYN